MFVASLAYTQSKTNCKVECPLFPFPFFFSKVECRLFLLLTLQQAALISFPLSGLLTRLAQLRSLAIGHAVSNFGSGCGWLTHRNNDPHRQSSARSTKLALHCVSLHILGDDKKVVVVLNGETLKPTLVYMPLSRASVVSMITPE